MLSYGSVCSGVEAASVAWEPLGFKPLWFSEIEPFPSAVLKHHWPHIQNLGDMRGIADGILQGKIPVPDVLVGGTPCQSFSVAGRRGSLADDRGNLTLELVRIFNAIDSIRKRNGKQPAILVWENVPGVLSTKDNAFGYFLGALAGENVSLEPAGRKWTNAGFVSGCKRDIAWRKLDAQYFGVPQRRRRIFLVASARDEFYPAEILFEQQSGGRHFAPSAGEESEIAKTLTTRPGLRGNASVDTYVVVNGRQDPLVSTLAQPLDSLANTNVVVNITEAYSRLTGDVRSSPLSPTLTARMGTGGGNVPNVISLNCVRRLTPLECERLQGFPDNHTRIPYRNKAAFECPDTPRYKAIGNSMAVPVMFWIGKRIRQHLASI